MKAKRTIGLSVLALLVMTACENPKEKKVTLETENYAVNTTASDSLCLADSVWFSINPSTGKRRTSAPKEGSSSVFGNNATVSNCDFHRWSWQKFLWLTNDVSGNPLFIDSLIQVDQHAVPVTKNGKKIILTANDQSQATGDTLRSNKSFNANDSSYTIYYSIHADSSLYESIQYFAPMDPNNYKDSTFPVGALEVKIAWVNADAIDDLSTYFVTDGQIEGQDVQIALLGMHVTGVVYNHPEFVWATFEHQDLVPYYNWDSTTTTDIPVTSATNKLLFDSTAVGTISNITSGNDSSNVFAVNRYGVPRQAGNTFLLTSQSEPENYNNIDMINNSVHAQLTDIWNNYFYNGSIWINTENYSYPTEQAQLLDSLSGSLSSSTQGDLTRGSVAAYNITMETYEQLGFSPTSIHGQNVQSLGNCFSCHNAYSGSPLNISHIFNGAVDKTNSLTIPQTKQKHLNDIKAFVKRMK